MTGPPTAVIVNAPLASLLPLLADSTTAVVESDSEPSAGEEDGAGFGLGDGFGLGECDGGAVVRVGGGDGWWVAACVGECVGAGVVTTDAGDVAVPVAGFEPAPANRLAVAVA
jgi:hypothetical protein